MVIILTVEIGIIVLLETIKDDIIIQPRSR